MDIKNKIEATLHSLDGMQRATASPYLFTRLQAYLQTREPENFWMMTGRLLNRPVVAIGAMFILILINFAIVVKSDVSDTDPKSIATATNYGNDLLSTNILSNYDLESTQP